MKNPEKIWQKLVKEVCLLPAKITRNDFFNFLVEWITDNRKIIGGDEIKRFGLDYLITLKPDNYPLVDANNDVSPLVEKIQEVSPKSMSALVMFLRDYLESLITFSIPMKCSSCGGTEMIILRLIDYNSNKFVFMCPLCNFTQSKKGEPIKNVQAVIATQYDVEDCLREDVNR